MRVLYLIDTLEVGGTERSLLGIAAHLPTAAPTVAAVYPGAALRPAFEAVGVPVETLDVGGRYAFGAATRAVKNLIDRVRPDVVHVALFRASIAGRLAGRWAGVPVVDSFVSESSSPRRRAGLSATGRAKLAAVWAIDRATAPLVDRFIAVSEVVRHSEARSLGVALNRVAQIPRGRDISVYSADRDSTVRVEMRAGLNVPAGAPLVLNVGRLREGKGQSELVRAFAAVRGTHPDALLAIAGEGPLRPIIEDAVSRAGLGDAVALLGHRDDIPALLAAADVFAFPSHFEGHPGSLIEAMLAGAPIVASDIAVHRETLEDGATARLVPLGDERALAAAIAALLADPAAARALGTAAARVARERYDVRRVAERHEALYREVLADARP